MTDRPSVIREWSEGEGEGGEQTLNLLMSLCARLSAMSVNRLCPRVLSRIDPVPREAAAAAIQRHFYRLDAAIVWVRYRPVRPTIRNGRETAGRKESLK